MQQDVHTLPTIAKTTKTKPHPVTFLAAEDCVVNPNLILLLSHVSGGMTTWLFSRAGNHGMICVWSLASPSPLLFPSRLCQNKANVEVGVGGRTYTRCWNWNKLFKWPTRTPRLLGTDHAFLMDVVAPRALVGGQ